MSRGLTITLVASVLVLALGVAGLAAYVFLMPAGPRANAGSEQPIVIVKESGSASLEAETFFLKTKNFVTDLADQDRLRYIDVTVSVAMKDAPALELAKKSEPQIRDIILTHIRTQVSSDLMGAAGKEKLADGLQKGLSELLKDQLKKVYITDLVIQ